MTSSASPSRPLTPALTAVPILDDEDDDDDELLLAGRESSADVAAFAVAVAVTVVVTVTGVVSVLLGDVEPDVRLKITDPASTKIGAVLPFVAVIHVLLYALPGLQQNAHCFWTFEYSRRCIDVPPLGLTTTLVSV